MSTEITVIENSITERQAITEDLYEKYIEYLDASPKTVETYTRALRRFFCYIALNNIRQPTREDLIAFRDELKASGHKPTTVQNYMTATRLFFSWTALTGIYPNIADHLKGARLDKQHKRDYLTSAQVKNVLSGIDTTTAKGLRDYAILALMTTCGLRTIEVSRSDIRDLRTLADSTVLYIQGKGREERTEYVKVSAPVEKAIRAYLKTRGNAADTEPLFCSLSNNGTGSRLSTRSISGIVKEHFIAAGYDSERLTAHSLRHTAVTLSLLAGKDITEVQQFARHANIATTMIYNHALEKSKNTCSEAVTDAIFM